MRPWVAFVLAAMCAAGAVLMFKAGEFGRRCESISREEDDDAEDQ